MQRAAISLHYGQKHLARSRPQVRNCCHVALRVGGGGREQWMVILPVAGLIVLSTVLLGGPEEALDVLEHTLYALWDSASMLLRR